MIKQKYILIGFLGFFLLGLLYFLLVTYPRLGKVAVEVLAHPSDTTITIDGDAYSPGTIYLRPGEYTLLAKKNGWTNATASIIVTKQPRSVALVLEPDSVQAYKILEDEKVIAEREALAAVTANARGEDIRSRYPIIERLPYSDISGPFKIDFGFDQLDKTTPYLIVSFSTPKGRRLAIDWLKKNNVDLVKTEVIFEGFNNPFQTNKVTH